MSIKVIPQLSIITINLNNEEGLRKTINSVLSQTWKDFEFIVIDGGSTDGSKAVLEQSKKDIAFWISENDSGVYNAMNKGIAKARGNYLLFLNSGDYLYSENVLQEFFSDQSDQDLIYANIFVADSLKSWVKRYPAELTFGYFLRETLPHPATLINRLLFNKVGVYNESNKVVSDWEFFMNSICLHQASYKYLNFTATVFHLDGMSSKEENAGLITDEKNSILFKYYGAFLADYSRSEKNRSDLKRYNNSRLHKFINKIMKTAIYKFLVSFA